MEMVGVLKQLSANVLGQSLNIDVLQISINYDLIYDNYVAYCTTSVV
jgi:hypothetical protein